ncbi:pyridoxamine 5'-phosphate oxidase family protein [Micromonospora inaquosa]|uniref:Pyridoxamine 5'-phosphate oxidase n=1 Tax=Micromonospora inaquosa TaxID=2203716 RepID=A0A3N9WCN9_9ACTN|nr:pyridoxamine 5'-phosphate oxidase family protein [Micromonospora inaquosa]RQW98489.1 pyridoxamine 5'-phosphate oxidase [Micromonospora inaquosa]
MSHIPSNPPADVEVRLTDESNVWLCTLRRDGSPHLTPVWFVYLFATFWVGCESRSVKARNVVADPRVSVALESGNAPVVWPCFPYSLSACSRLRRPGPGHRPWQIRRSAAERGRRLVTPSGDPRASAPRVGT